MSKTIFAADIGGTHSRFGHFEFSPERGLSLVSKIWLPTAGSDSFPCLLDQLAAAGFALHPAKADIAVIAGAGPVEGGRRISPPNIPWDISIDPAETEISFGNALLINDFVAHAYACRSPVGRETRTILAGEADPDGITAVLGGGTGLGKALLVPAGTNRFRAFPSEGGHALFPFETVREFAFHDFCRKKSGATHITGNLVVSGIGLSYLHEFLAGEELIPPEIASRLTPDSETLAWTARFHGRVCRNFALEILARGGLYLAGGIAARNPEILNHEEFRREFLDSPTMGRILARIPVLLFDNQDSGLWGAAFLGQQHLLES